MAPSGVFYPFPKGLTMTFCVLATTPAGLFRMNVDDAAAARATVFNLQARFDCTDCTFDICHITDRRVADFTLIPA